MLRFFRNIRQRLLTDNKVSKYLLYAVGEILLVVIGILIALQINNWNEWRKDREKEHKILESLSENLHRNIEIFHNGLGMIQKLDNSSKIVFDIIDEKITYEDTIYDHFGLASQNGVMQGLISFEGYENYKNAGFDIILSDTVKSSVLYLFEVRYPEQDAFRQLLLEQVSENIHENRMILSQYFSRSKILDIDRFLKARDAHVMYSNINVMRSLYKWELNTSLEDTESVLQLIKEELHKKL